MIKLCQFPPCWNLPNASPFCMKLETYLRMTGTPYEVVTYDNPAKGPKGKMPFIIDGDKRIGDSDLIIHYLKNKNGDVLDAHLTPEQQAQALAFKRLIEEHLYWATAYSRWLDPAGWAVVREAYFGRMPGLLKKFVPELIQKKMKKAMELHGIGRHTPEEIYQMGKDDISAISHFLAEKPYFLGDKPSSLDATAYAFIANLLEPPVESPLKKHAGTLPNLKAYCERMKETYY